MLYGAERLLAGDMIYRDFWTLYPPGGFLLLAMVFHVFGSWVLLERCLTLLFLSTLTLQAVHLVCPARFTRRAYLIWGLLVLWFSSDIAFGSPIYPALCSALASLFAFRQYLAIPKVATLWWVGIATGITMLFRHDFGLFLWIAQTLTLAFHRVVIVNRWRHWGMATALIPSLIVLWLVGNQSSTDAFEAIVQFPTTVYPVVRSLPVPTWTSTGWIFLLPGILLITTLWTALRTRDINLLAWGGFGVLLLLHVGIRSDWRHLLPLMLIALIPVVQHLTAGRRVIQLTRGLTLLALLGGTCMQFWTARIAAAQSLPHPLDTYQVPRARGFFLDSQAAHDQQAALAQIRALVPTSEAIFVALAESEALGINDILFYFLAERASATRFHELHPGLINQESVQEEIINALEARRVTYIVRHTLGDVASSPLAATATLDQYLRDQFRPIAHHGRYEVWQRRPLNVTATP